MISACSAHPAKAGIQRDTPSECDLALDPRLRGDERLAGPVSSALNRNIFSLLCGAVAELQHRLDGSPRFAIGDGVVDLLEWIAGDDLLDRIAAEPDRRDHPRQEFLGIAVAENNAAKRAAADHHMLDIERDLG